MFFLVRRAPLNYTVYGIVNRCLSVGRRRQSDLILEDYACHNFDILVAYFNQEAT